MDVAAVHCLVDAIVVADADAGDRGALSAAVGDVSRLLAWCQGQQIRLARLIAAAASFPEQALAGPAHIGLPGAAKLLDRATTASAAPLLEAAVVDGYVSGEHIDAVTRALRSVEPDLRDELLARADTLVDVASASTPEEFARRLRLEARRLETDDGMTRYERQRRAARLRSWTDHETGMWCLSGRFDPLTGATVSQALDGQLSRLFAEAVPDTCPSDPFEKQDHLRALAFVALVTGKGGGGVGRPEAIVVIDARDPDPVTGGPIIDWGLPVEVPTPVLNELLQRADIHTVMIRNGVVISGPGELDLGRTTRLANRAQRLVLRALYPTCAIPGCATRFNNCKIHHVVEWDDHGLTDLCNLIPICAHHHTTLHADNWQLILTADRTLTINLPDRTTLTNGPPKRGTGSSRV
ncbi:MAG: HNH endonuclease [Ilumatobacteraceae bacterium]